MAQITGRHPVTSNIYRRNSFQNTWQRSWTLPSDNITDCIPGEKKTHNIFFYYSVILGVGRGGCQWPSAEALSTPMAAYQVFEAVYLRFSCSRDTALRHWMILPPTFRDRSVAPKHWANGGAQLPRRTKTSKLKVSKKIKLLWKETWLRQFATF